MKLDQRGKNKWEILCSGGFIGSPGDIVVDDADKPELYMVLLLKIKNL